MDFSQQVDTQLLHNKWAHNSSITSGHTILPQQVGTQLFHNKWTCYSSTTSGHTILPPQVGTQLFHSKWAHNSFTASGHTTLLHSTLPQCIASKNQEMPQFLSNRDIFSRRNCWRNSLELHRNINDIQVVLKKELSCTTSQRLRTLVKYT